VLALAIAAGPASAATKPTAAKGHSRPNCRAFPPLAASLAGTGETLEFNEVGPDRFIGKLPRPASELRAAANSHILGLVLERYVLEIEPLASANHEQVIVLIAPSLQRYLDTPTGRT
jgi:hypothetical protein